MSTESYANWCYFYYKSCIFNMSGHVLSWLHLATWCNNWAKICCHDLSWWHVTAYWQHVTMLTLVIWKDIFLAVPSTATHLQYKSSLYKLCALEKRLQILVWPVRGAQKSTNMQEKCKIFFLETVQFLWKQKKEESERNREQHRRKEG